MTTPAMSLTIQATFPEQEIALCGKATQYVLDSLKRRLRDAVLTAVDAPNVTVIIGFFPGDSFITRSAVHNLLQMLTGCQGIGNPMRWYRNAQDCWFLCYERPSLLKRSKS